ncbi:hypothetical protein [Streptomyces virginiae]|uniref:hypothetical protein n=1 Tax=Streptomyces virginiae TaxID=1961 RepID=UPI0036F10CB0
MAGPARPLGRRGPSPAPRVDFVTGLTDVAVAVAVGVRGRAAIALGYVGAALPIADVFAEGRWIFDRVGSHEQTSGYAVPFWRINVFTSLLAARIGDEITAVVAARDSAAAELPESLPRFATRLEMRRG